MLQTNTRVGVRALGVLDLLRTEEVGPDFLPSSSYPSDHIAIAADLEVICYKGTGLISGSGPGSVDKIRATYTVMDDSEDL